MYRRASRVLHPDRSGDDGSRFVAFQEEFRRYQLEWRQHRASSELRRVVDPTKVLTDLGVPPGLPPRSALFVTLYRFRSLGLDRRRLRLNPSLARRNDEIIRTFQYWALEYDETTLSILTRFLMPTDTFGLGEAAGPVYFRTRRVLLRSLDLLIRFQDNHRPATRDIALDLIAYAESLIQHHRISAVRRDRTGSFSGIIGMSAWLRRQLSLPPQRLGLDS